MGKSAEGSGLFRGLSRISVRLLAFNVLLVFLPVSGMLFLGTYEEHLLVAQERTMVQEGRLLAAAIESSTGIDSTAIRALLVQLGQRQQARLRVVNHEGTLLADSARLGPRREGDSSEQSADADSDRDSFLYRLGSLPFRLFRGSPEQTPGIVADRYDTAGKLVGTEIRKALEGSYGSATRIGSGAEPAVTLYSAIPVRIEGEVGAAVLVSQSTDRIMQTLDAVRLRVFRVFLVSLIVAVVLSLLTATTIVNPLNRLQNRAEAILDRTGRLRGRFAPSRRLDEIGDLERALAELTRRLEGHISATESFAADVAHEFKNPLASIRTAAEMLDEVEDPQLRDRFSSIIQRELARMERLLSGARELSRIDAGLEEEERREFALDELISAIIDGFRMRLRDDGPTIDLAIARQPLVILASADHLTQVFENILDNAVSFSPNDDRITVTMECDDDWITTRIGDRGPGIPVEHQDRIFSRFFSYRPSSTSKTSHLGLGLALAKAIVEAHGGTVDVRNRPDGGAEFEIVLPVHPTSTP
ncbi:MAG: hypothetical protein GY906_00945 [bacterium]|nr:hypothetical protein [bacterium]